MTPSEYQALATNTENKEFVAISKRLTHSTKIIRLLHASQGLATEAGEFTDALKKHIFYGKELDLVNLAEEVGDILWYAALACNTLGVSLEEVMEKNIKKLQKRYPEKFTKENALTRNTEEERKILEEETNVQQGRPAEEVL